MKLVVLINAASAITKIARSEELPSSYVWDILDFVEQASKESKKFDLLRAKIVDNNTKEKDGEELLNVDGYVKELNELFEKEIEIDTSVLDIEQIKKVEGLSVTEVLAIKELIQE